MLTFCQSGIHNESLEPVVVGNLGAGWPSLAVCAMVPKPNTTAQKMPLAHPISVQLTLHQISWLDSRRGDVISRSAAIRQLIEDAMLLHDRGILPATKTSDKE